MKLPTFVKTLAAFGLALALAGAGHAEEAAMMAEEAAMVDVNTADAATIASALSGVGMAKAQAIVRYREEHGRFTDIDELTRVRGIGAATVAKNEARISLGE